MKKFIEAVAEGIVYPFHVIKVQALFLKKLWHENMDNKPMSSKIITGSLCVVLAPLQMVWMAGITATCCVSKRFRTMMTAMETATLKA